MKFRSSTEAEGTLRLHFNENTGGCSPAVLEALRRLTATDVAVYPDYTATTRKVADWLGVDESRVLLTNGLDGGLLLAAEYGAWHSDRLGAEGGQTAARPEFIVTEPAFEMFSEFTGVVRAELVSILPRPDLKFPLTDVLDAITPATRIVYLIDPNNPTGLPLPPGAAELIADAAPHATIFVDEAYADFSGHTLVGGPLERHPNLLVGRTFAKAHGLAGLRIGALVGQPSTIERIGMLRPPFDVNVAALRAVEAALDDGDFLAWSVAQATESRELAYEFCRRHEFEFWSSAGNFVLMRIGGKVADVTAALAARGILARDKSAAPGCTGCLRITTGVVEHTERALEALEDILATRTY